MAITFDVAAFRAAFPAFASESLYPNAFLEGKWDSATCIVSPDTDCTTLLSVKQRTRVLNLLTAHLVELGNLIAEGFQGGYVNSASVDKVSVSLDPPKTKSKFQWWLSQTPYGQEASAIMEMAGIGGLYVGGTPERDGFRSYGGRFGSSGF